MFGNMLLISYLDFLHSILKENVSESGSNIKIWGLLNNVFQLNETDITIGEPHTSSLENSWDKSNLEFLKTNTVQSLHILWTYLHHLVREAKVSSISRNPYSILLPDQFYNLTWKEFMAWRLEDSNQSTSFVSSAGHQGYTKQDSRYESIQNVYQLLVFKKSTKREGSQYTMLKDEKYFEASKRNLLVTVTTHGCEEILNEITNLKIVMIVGNYL